MDNSGRNGITITKSAAFLDEKIAALKFERPLDLSVSELLNLEFEDYYYAWLSWGLQLDDSSEDQSATFGAKDLEADKKDFFIPSIPGVVIEVEEDLSNYVPTYRYIELSESESDDTNPGDSPLCKLGFCPFASCTDSAGCDSDNLEECLDYEVITDIEVSYLESIEITGKACATVGASNCRVDEEEISEN